MQGRRRLIHTYTGINKLGRPPHLPQGVELAKVVAVDDGSGWWAAYMENAKTRELDNTNEAIADHGHKLPAGYATDIFPEIANRIPYRD